MMKKHLYLFIWMCLCPVWVWAQQPADWVDPFIGTAKMGHTFPGACRPFGMVQLSPDTDTIPHNVRGVYQKQAYAYCAGYQYTDSTIVGFSHTHLSGTGHSDLGDILLMPTSGSLQLNPGTRQDPDSGYRSRFSHQREQASAGYYAVNLDDYGIRAELTATPRVGVHRYTFSEADSQHLVLDLLHGIYNYDGKTLWAQLRVENDTLITGYRITSGWARTHYTYFAIALSKPIQDYGCREFSTPEQAPYKGFWRKFDQQRNFPEMGGRRLRAYFSFRGEEPLLVRCALSAVSTEGARRNLQAEAPHTDFDQYVREARQDWNSQLGVLQADAPAHRLKSLYTSLYHAMIHPSVYMDVDGQYRGIDHQVHRAEGFSNHTVFSLWDTYRALHPLFNVFCPDRSRDLVASMLAHYRQSVHRALPVWSHFGNENWCMIGYHAVSAIADAFAKGIAMDTSLALQAMDHSANLPYYDHLSTYVRQGYVPHGHSPHGVSMTLEYAYDDWAIASMAQALGRADMAARYLQRAANYRKVFDPALGFARPRDAQGGWHAPFDLLDTHGQGFIEGNSWNYSFYVPHDVPGLAALMGGRQRFERRLDSLFSMRLDDRYFAHTEDVTKEGIIGNYVHGNEPSHHIPYLYAWTSAPWKAQERIRQIMDERYLPAADGLCGNDDAGQMSAWYVFSALGFYPLCPGTDQYVLGTPYLSRASIRLSGGREFVVRAEGLSDANRYIQKVLLNGRNYHKAYITHGDVMQGGTLTFVMGRRPNKQRVFQGDQLPYSLSAHPQ